VVYAVQGQFAFRNAARRDAVMQNVQTRLAAEAKWGETTTQAVNPSGQGGAVEITDPTLIVEVRFTTDAARDSFWNDVIAFMGGGVNGPVAGSSIWQHDCPHDGAGGPCVVSQRRDY
jgi:hypothetical protein